MAYAMAKESSHVKADVVEVQEFPQLAQRYMVRGVPKTVINDAVEFVGAVPEEVFLQHILQAISDVESDGDEGQVSDQITPIT